MVTSPQLFQQMVKVLVAAAHPIKIILFGSQARGEATVRSDVDVLVVFRHITNKYLQSIQLKKALRVLNIPLDLLVVDEDEFEDRQNVPGTVIYWANKEGVVIYANKT